MNKKYTHCINCSSEFNSKNTFTKEGWRETQISGMCERCFDLLFDPPFDVFSNEEFEDDEEEAF